MLFSLLVLNLFLAHGRIPVDAATGPTSTGPTQEDQQIDDECSPRMRLGVDHYAACVADKKHEAEAAELRRLAEVRHMKEIIGGTAEPDPEPIQERVCNADAVLRACAGASSTAARANNPSSTDSQISQALRSCRLACNPHLSGCENITSLKQTMLQTMNNCGVGTTAQNEDESYFGAIKASVSNLANSATSYGTQAWDWLSSEAKSRSSQASTPVFFQSGAGGAAFVPPPDRSGNFPRESDPLGAPVSGFEGSSNAEFSGVRPQPRPDNLGVEPPSEATPDTAPDTGRETQDTAAQAPPADTNNDQQVVTPVQPNEPVPYQPGNFAGLQSAMNTPPGGMASSSSMGGGEVSNGGSSSRGSYSDNSTGPVSRPLAFPGSGQISPSALRGAETPAAPVAGGSRPAMDVAAPGGASRGGGSFDFGGGRMMASSRPAAPASLESSMTTAMRSDSYYRTAGGRAAGAAARSVAKRSTPCKGPNCPRKTRTGIAAANCDGNPQCLLALTGKLQGSRRQPTEEVWETDSGGVRRVRANAGDRGIASVPHKTMPGGIVRGKIQDVLNHLGSSEVFKVDHDGMLEVDL